MVTSCRSEAFGLDHGRIMPSGNQCCGGEFDEGSGAADEARDIGGRWKGVGGDLLGGEAAGGSGEFGWGAAGEREEQVDAFGDRDRPGAAESTAAQPSAAQPAIAVRPTDTARPIASGRSVTVVRRAVVLPIEFAGPTGFTEDAARFRPATVAGAARPIDFARRITAAEGAVRPRPIAFSRPIARGRVVTSDQLLAVVHVGGVSQGVDQTESTGVSRLSPSTEHGGERHYAGAARHQDGGAAGFRVPDEPAADGAADFYQGADGVVVDQVAGDFAVGDALDGDLDGVAGGGAESE
ncbi:hypothetical protein Ntsu_55190 [Nocardia sp. IFM 10818]